MDAGGKDGKARARIPAPAYARSLPLLALARTLSHARAAILAHSRLYTRAFTHAIARGGCAPLHLEHRTHASTRTHARTHALFWAP
eukprot:2681510-Pleurochrysis_carterae.AAC.1